MRPLDLAPEAPWRQRYRAPVVAGCSLAEAAPERGVVLYNGTGVYQLYAWDVPSAALRQLSHRPEGLLQYSLSPDGRYVYYLDDRQGNEIGHFARFAYDAVLRPDTSVDVTPDLPPYSPAGIGSSRANNRLGIMTARPTGFDLYVLDLTPEGGFGAPRALFHSEALAFGPFLSHAGEVAVVMSAEKTGRPEFSLIAIDTATGQRLAELWDGDNTSLEAVRFSPVPGDLRLVATTTRSGIEQMVLWNPVTGERRDIELPGVPGSVRPADWSANGEYILLQTFNQAVQWFYLYHLDSGQVTPLDHPPGTYGSVAFGPDNDIVALLEDSVRPKRLVALDAATGAWKRDLLPGPRAPAGRRWSSVSFASSDGQAVQAWLATPEGEGPFPAIVEMIGGPTSVRVEGYMPSAQAWLDHGFAFLTVNYRGCTSFGRDFETKIVGDLGHWEVEDIVAARNYLVESGVADPDQILITGWSYGGYLTLMSLSLYPDLWAGGMAGIAIADWAVQYEDTADMLRGFQTALLGGTPETAAEQYAKSSPITYAERVQAPVLIIQGRNDTRTPARPIVNYEAKMKALGKAIEVDWFETGHLGSFADVELSVRHQERLLRFAYRVLG